MFIEAFKTWPEVLFNMTQKYFLVYYELNPVLRSFAIIFILNINFINFISQVK